MAATNEQSSMLVPLRGEDLAEGPNDNLQPHEISTLLIQQGNLDEQLHEISTLLIQEGNLDALYHRILDAAMVVMSSDMASMQLLDPERKQLRLLAWKGFHPQSAAFWEWVHFHSTTTCGLASSAGCRVVVPDIEPVILWRARLILMSIVDQTFALCNPRHSSHVPANCWA